jgi:hypothetical protein
MKALRYGISCTFVAGFTLIAACGGSTDDTGDAAAGQSAGGRSATNAGAPGAGGRFGGIPSFGGATNNASCPTSAPADATACSAAMSCSYASARCSCERGGGGMMGGTATGREWNCTAMLVCPATKPTVGGACMPAQGSCRYDGMGSCSCSAQTSTWACQNGGMTGGGGFPGFPGSGGGINGSAGASSGTTCPATKPTANTACTGTDACPYADGGCQCMSDKWTCL